MTSSRKLIDLHLTGQSARYLIDSLVEELPPPEVIRMSVLRDLPKGSNVTLDEGVVYIQCEDARVVAEKLPLFELMYPELDFVHKNDT
jgi:hypothetical protein